MIETKTIKTNSTQNFSNRERKNCPNFSCKKIIYFSKMLISRWVKKNNMNHREFAKATLYRFNKFIVYQTHYDAKHLRVQI